MKEKTSVLDMYYDFCSKGIKMENGLCGRMRIRFREEWELISPNDEELIRHEQDGYSPTYWGEKLEVCINDAGINMTPLRQNIVLFIAAMRNEL